jgi:hypothetical protein
MAEEQEPEDIKHDDAVLMCAPPFDEAIHEPIPPTQGEEDEVSHFSFQVFDNSLFYDSENEEEMEPLDKIEPMYYKVEDVEAFLPFDEVNQTLEAPTLKEVSVSYFPFQIFNDSLSYDVENKEVLDVLTPSCYDEDDHCVDNIDEFIHVGKHKWDVIGYDRDPIYNIEGRFQRLPLPLSREVTNRLDIWQQGHDMVTNLFQTPKDDLMLCSPDHFRSYLEDFDEYPFEHSDLFYEENYQPSLCSDLDKSEEVAFLKWDTCDKILHLPLITLPCYVTKGMVWKHVPYSKSSVG